MPLLFKRSYWIFLPLGLILLVLAASGGEFVYARGLAVTPMPTPDRLAKPTMPANPSQADRGAQDYWLYCSPCHGDKAQGLTEDFRRQYPVEDQNCWLSGCHGRRPYPNGWTIPPVVPALVGPGALSKFGNGLAVQAYMRLKMPFQTPGSLDADTYWRLTAFLLRENGYWSGDGILDELTAERVRIPFAQTEDPTPAPTPLPDATAKPQIVEEPAPIQQVVSQSGSPLVRVISGGLLLLLGVGLFLLIRRNKLS